MLLSFPALFTLAFALFTAGFKANNFVPILPFTSLYAAVALAVLWRWPTRHLKEPRFTQRGQAVDPDDRGRVIAHA